MSKHVVIIGNGITGVTAARFIRKLSNHRITVISAETDHFYARTALMYIYMGHMRYRDTKPYEDGFWAKNRIDLVRGYVTEIDTEERCVHVGGGRTLAYDVLVMATGSRSNMFGWPGQDLDGVQGLYGMQDLATLERWTEGIDRAVVVGGGLIGIELAEMLHARRIPVTFLVREQGYMDYLLPAEESELIRQEIMEHGIDLRLGEELKAILPDAERRARAVVTSSGDEISCGCVGLAAGVHPNIDVARASGIEAGRGILVNEFFETSAPGVYAAGDCAEFRRDGIGSRRIEQLWYTGRRHGRAVAQTVCGRRTAYDRGVFFNSAKFFTLEYQTYGSIAPRRPDGIRTLLWTAGRRRKLLRIDYAEENRRVVGFNSLGVRLRHDVCEHWLLGGVPISEVVRHLRQALFDPEFCRNHAGAVAAIYHQTESVHVA